MFPERTYRRGKMKQTAKQSPAAARLPTAAKLPQCPERMWLSVYYDNEMESPWKEKMEAHIAGCADCAKQLAAYKEISLSLENAAGDAREEEARLRVLQKLETSGPYRAYKYPRLRGPSVWKRRVSIPVPAAAAAAVFMLTAIAFLWNRGSQAKPDTSNMAIAAETEIIPDIIPLSGTDNVLQYLGSTDTGDILILRLPESRNFASYGEPTMIKAADYSRNAPGRRK